MHLTKKNLRALIAIFSFLLLFIFVFVAGVVVGVKTQPESSRISSLFNKEQAFASPVDFDPFWKVWSLIDEKYPDKEKVDDQTKVWGAIKGLASSVGDPYTIFFDPSENKAFNETIEGSFSGIGVEVGIKNGLLTVIAPLKDSPGEKAGLLPGDTIIAIDGTSTADMSIEDAVEKIKGQKGTKVTLTVIRAEGNESEDIAITRDVIAIPTLESHLRDDGVFVISLYNFSENAPILFQGALRQFFNTKSNKLILDLRGNPGGYLDGAVDIASWFLPLGKPVVREDFGKDKENVYRSKGYNVFRAKPITMVVLVDGGSASASEILAGALKEHGIATLVGEKTFGKGTVQELIPITSETSLKITVAKWLTPNGLSIEENGLTPDYEVSFGEEDIASGKDPQMEKALSLLLGEKTN